MKRQILRLGGPPLLILLISLILMVAPVGAASGPQQDNDLVKHGEYIVHIAGCLGCHAPVDEKFQPTLDMLGAGGLPFDQGELGIVYTKNVTEGETSGIGECADDGIIPAFTARGSGEG